MNSRNKGFNTFDQIFTQIWGILLSETRQVNSADLTESF